MKQARKIAILLYRYFPYGGLQRDFLEVGKELQSRGITFKVFTRRWEGSIPDGFSVEEIGQRGLSNFSKNRKLESNIIDPYIGQKAEGKIVDFESKKSIQKKELKVFKFKSTNQYIKIFTPEFIAVCPFSGLPDIAKITIEYFPKGGLALELKALKYYLISYKNVGIYQEEVTKNIHLDLKEILNTDKIKITTEYNVRGGLYTTCIEGSI